MFAVRTLSLARRKFFCVPSVKPRFLSTENHSPKGLSAVKKYVFSSYVEFIKSYENKLEKKFPTAIRVYKIFKVGFQDFYQDLKMFIKIKRKLTFNDISCLTRKELELNHQMPIDMMKVAPVLLISALPLANYVAFPIAYFFPRHLLSRQFWTLQQRARFAVLEQKIKLASYKPVFRFLQAKMHLIKGHPTKPVWKQCIAQLGSGLHPNSEKIHESQILFCNGEVYDIDCLSPRHIRSLLKMHNMHLGLRRRKRLIERARLIVYLDKAIINEGGVNSLPYEDVRKACFFRGLNPTNMNSEDTVIWLNEWIQLTTRMKDENWSYVLHLPILMAYNHPSNWVLIH
ncbi:LETM1 domain-containing protein 1 isoform X2 [Cimex lectularius]|uniref:Letm1 RBD domain-containing protein n=1 Tax=Cimex lectularius TaxID=79782 RepID=A0A8I6SBY3_CIMLE|nr:LETM1 domain-containing protein 1 isoform X2 [Cimex lectularius]